MSTRAIEQELKRVRRQNKETKKMLAMFTLADKAQKIISGTISSADEYDEFGMRVDGEMGSRYVFDPSDSLEAAIAAMKPVDIRDTQNIEIMLKRYPQSEVLAALAKFNLQGWEIAD